jgi:formate-dependent nitrite reductase membrane component NrfD
MIHWEWPALLWAGVNNVGLWACAYVLLSEQRRKYDRVISAACVAMFVTFTINLAVLYARLL